MRTSSVGSRLRLWLAALLRRWADWLAPTTVSRSVGMTPLGVAASDPHPLGPWYGVERVAGENQGMLYTGPDGGKAAELFLHIKHGGQRGTVVFWHDGLVRDRYEGRE